MNIYIKDPVNWDNYKNTSATYERFQKVRQVESLLHVVHIKRPKLYTASISIRVVEWNIVHANQLLTLRDLVKILLHRLNRNDPIVFAIIFVFSIEALAEWKIYLESLNDSLR